MLNRFLTSAICAGFLALTLAVAPTAPAIADEHGSGDLGLLRCDIEGKSNFVFKSTTRLDCLYSPSEGESRSYKGEITQFGLDIGFIDSGVILWSVFGPKITDGADAIVGSYVGASATAAVIGGVKVNVLVNDRRIELIPVNVGGVIGANAAVGVAELVLSAP